MQSMGIGVDHTSQSWSTYAQKILYQSHGLVFSVSKPAESCEEPGQARSDP
jgi:hypothetical protein